MGYRVEKLVHMESGIDRYSNDTLFKSLKLGLPELELGNELFESLLCSFPARLMQVREVKGGKTDF